MYLHRAVKYQVRRRHTMAKKSANPFIKFLAVMSLLSATASTEAFSATESDAIPMTVVECVQRTNMERNALKRAVDKKIRTPFTMSANLETKSASIDFALTELHTLHGLAKQLGYSENYIQRHINHLKNNFNTTCKMISEGKAFKFVSI
jgi:hypothetical protein